MVHKALTLRVYQFRHRRGPASIALRLGALTPSGAVLESVGGARYLPEHMFVRSFASEL